MQPQMQPQMQPSFLPSYVGAQADALPMQSACGMVPGHGAMPVQAAPTCLVTPQFGGGASGERGEATVVHVSAAQAP
jgi:hypothetical protein